MTLANFQLNTPLELHVDSSNVGWGAVLIQDGRLIGCQSGSWNATQQNYHVREQELMSGLLSLRAWRQYCLAVPTTVFTDHSANCQVSLRSAHINYPKLCRWVMEILEYPVTWRHVKGVENGLPDFISRLQEDLKED